MKNYLKISSISIIFVSLLMFTQPANAYVSLTVPKQFTELWQKVQAQEASIIAPAINDTIFCDALGKQTTKDECGVASGQQTGSTIIFCDALGRQTTKDECALPTSQQPDSTIIFCNILGKQTTKGECPGNNQQPQQNNNQQMMNQPSQNQNQPQQNNQQQQNNQPTMGKNGGNNQNSGPNGGDQTRMLKDVQRNAKQMENMVSNFEKQMVKAEKSGGVLPQELKDQTVKAKELLAKIKSATTADELGDDTMNQLQEIVQNLDQSGRDVFDKIQQLNNVKKDIKNFDRDVSNFDKQIAKLAKQKITIPQDITDNLAKLKTVVTTVKTAKTWDDVQNAGLENIGDLMNSVNDNRQQLDSLSRWPQAIKQIDKDIKDLDRRVKKAKTVVDKLQKQGIDLTENYNTFATGVEGIKTARTDAVAKMQAGDIQGAFDTLQNDYFDNMDNVGQSEQIIQTVGNLGQFQSSFKRDINNAKSTIAKLKKQGEDISDLQTLYDDLVSQGNGLSAMLKIKPIDIDVVVSALQDLSDVRIQFQDQTQSISGGGTMPWNQGQQPQQFQQLQMSPSLNQYMQQKPMNQQQPTNMIDQSNSPIVQ